MALARPGTELMRPEQRAALSDVLAAFQAEGFHRPALVGRRDELTDRLAAQFSSFEDLASLLRETAAIARWHRLGGYWTCWLAQQLAARLGSPWFGWAALQFGRAQVATACEDVGYDSMERGYVALLGVGDPALTSILASFRDLLTGNIDRLARAASPRHYADSNPASDNAYVLFTWREVCADCPELPSAGSGTEEQLNAALDRLTREGDAFARVVVLRHLGYLAGGRGDTVAAADRFGTALSAAKQAGIEPEIGQLLRSLGHAEQQLGKLDAALAHLSEAVRHDSHPVLSYWQGLDLRMLGSAWVSRLVADDAGPAVLGKANGAYRAGREILQAHLRLSTYLPLSRESTLQLLRPSADNAIQVAARLSSASDLLAEFDLQAPGDTLDAIVEFETIRAEGADPSRTYLEDRAVFVRRFQRADEDPSAYVAALGDEHPARSRYGTARLALTSRFEQQEQATAVAGLLALEDPDVVFLHFMIGDSRLGVCFSDGTGSLLSFGTAPIDEDELRASHAVYARALPPADLLARGLGLAQAEAALDELLTGYAERLAPILTPALAWLEHKHLKVFPRSFLNQLPLHALPVAGGRLIDVCDVSYAQSIGLLMRAHRNRSIRGPVNVITGARVSLLSELAASWAGTEGRLLDDPAVDELTTAVAGMGGQLIFACHGRYDPYDPGASELRFGPGQSTSMASLFGRLRLNRFDAVVMAACESALGRAEISSEFIGLPNVFAAAGVRYVIGSLWRVNQFASALLLDRYVALLATHAVPAALNQAQRDVATMTRDQLANWVSQTLPDSAPALLPRLAGMADLPFAHPRFWSGFYVQGDI